MEKTETASAKALNLQAITHHLTDVTSAAYIADELDEIIFNYTSCFRSDDVDLIAKKTFSDNIYSLVTLRNLFIRTVIANGGRLEFNRINTEF